MARGAAARAAGIDIGGNTSAQVSNRAKGIMVDDNRSGKRTFPPLDQLLPGDCVYWMGTPGNTWGVGHVEMVTGDDECHGHGSGTGPTRKPSLKSYSKQRTGDRRYLCTIRWIKDDEQVRKLGDCALSLGMVATDVAEMQLLLLSLGYNLGSSGVAQNGVDGDYGSKTAAAVKAEQAHIGVAETGNADVVTIAHIIAHALGQAAPSTEQHVLVTGGSVNIRSGPSAYHKILGDTKSGVLFEASGEAADGWIGIKYKQTNAWISEKYAEVVK